MTVVKATNIPCDTRGPAIHLAQTRRSYSNETPKAYLCWNAMLGAGSPLLAAFSLQCVPQLFEGSLYLSIRRNPSFSRRPERLISLARGAIRYRSLRDTILFPH